MGLHANTPKRLLAAAFLVAVVAACGGGGGGGSPGPEPAPSPAPSPSPTPSPAPQAVNWGNFPSAAVVIGQQDFDDGDAPVADSPDRLNFPVGSPGISADGTLFVAEQGANQVKVFRRYTDGNGPDAAFSIPMENASGASVHGQRLVILGSVVPPTPTPEQHVVHIYDSLPEAPPALGPDASAGAARGCTASGLNSPRSAFITPLGQLIVADTDNHRVLIWDSLGDGGPVGGAQVVIGQQDKATCPARATSDQTLNQPTSVWSDGLKLIVTDRRNHRVLIWENIPTTDFAAADHVIGQIGPEDALPNAGMDAPTASTLFDPMSVDVSDTGQMAVADRSNNRILIWNSIPTTDNQPADQVIGQVDFFTGGLSPVSAKTFNNPSGVRFDGRNLVVVDSSNNRALVFRALD